LYSLLGLAKKRTYMDTSVKLIPSCLSCLS